MVRNVNNEFIPGYSNKIRHFGPQLGHVKMTFSLFLEKISKKYESFECFLPGGEYYTFGRTLQLIKLSF